MKSSAFKPREHFSLENIAPTEAEFVFRRQLLRGDVHDPAAAMLGGVAGHAGLFSDAYDLAVLCQMLLNGGSLNGYKFFKQETVDLFTSYHSSSRRGLGFDKPERDNYQRPEPYPTASASAATYGHTGFTGTCVWVDPQYNLIYIFLSNRVYNNGDANRFNRMNIRPKVHEAIYQALGVHTPVVPLSTVVSPVTSTVSEVHPFAPPAGMVQQRKYSQAICSARSKRPQCEN